MSELRILEEIAALLRKAAIEFGREDLLASGVQLQTQSPEITFDRQRVQPPGPFYVARGEHLHVHAWNAVSNQVVSLNLRLLMPNGEIIPNVYELRPSADRSELTNTLTLPECFVLSFAVSTMVSGTRRGQTYVAVHYSRTAEGGETLVNLLTSGYVTEGFALSWPVGKVEHFLEGRGNYRSIQGTDPAAGLQINETVPTGARWRLLSVNATLSTNATAANRNVLFAVDDGSDNLIIIPAPNTQVANEGKEYTWAAWGTVQDSIVNRVTVPLPNEVWLQAGSRIGTAVVGMQAGDNWTFPRLYVEEFLER